LRFAGADRHGERNLIAVKLSPEAASLYESLYRGELRDRSSGEQITGLLDRRAPMLLRLAMLFALTDQTNIIAVEHLNAALAWVRYWTESVKFIFQSAADEAGTAEISDTTQRIAAYLAIHGPASRTKLNKSCFSGHLSKSTLDQALDELLSASPPIIEVTTVPRANGQPGSPTKVYKLCGSTALPSIMVNSEKTAESSKLETDLNPLRTLRNQLTEVNPEIEDIPDYAEFTKSEINQSQTSPNGDIDTSLVSLISQVKVEKEMSVTEVPGQHQTARTSRLADVDGATSPIAR
jgi:hypothetical protein